MSQPFPRLGFVAMPLFVFLDSFTTLLGITHGYFEQNPLEARLIGQLGPFGVVVWYPIELAAWLSLWLFFWAIATRQSKLAPVTRISSLSFFAYPVIAAISNLALLHLI